MQGNFDDELQSDERVESLGRKSFKKRLRTVAVNGIAKFTTKEEIIKLFESCGKIVSVNLKQNSALSVNDIKKGNYCRKQHAYVTFKSEKDTEKATKLNGYILNGDSIHVERQIGDSIEMERTVYLESLSPVTDEVSIYKHLENFGRIEKIRMCRNQRRAYVLFESSESVKHAFELNGKYLDGTMIAVLRKPSKGTKRKFSESGEHSSNTTKKVFSEENTLPSTQSGKIIILNIPFNTSDEEIKNLLEDYEGLVSIKVESSYYIGLKNVKEENDEPKKTAVVIFVTLKDAEKTKELNGKVLNGNVLNVKVVRNIKQSLNENISNKKSQVKNLKPGLKNTRPQKFGINKFSGKSKAKAYTKNVPTSRKLEKKSSNLSRTYPHQINHVDETSNCVKLTASDISDLDKIFKM